MLDVVCVAAARKVDGQGCLQALENSVDQVERLLQSPVRRLTIDPLSVDWYSDVAKDHFRSGCAPIEALEQAYKCITSGEEGAVLIVGVDRLRTGYSRDARRESMAIYDQEMPLTEAYDHLAKRFATVQGMAKEEFQGVRDQLFDNYWRTYTEKFESAHKPAERWFEPITDWFRGVDCANPVVDFEGGLLISSSSVARDLGMADGEWIEVAAVATECLPSDGPSQIEGIARYDHLQKAIEAVEQHCGETLVSLNDRKRLLLDVYTCYPVVPMAFLLRSGLVASISELSALLASQPVTQTGGMNLARGAWNNPALNALIEMFEVLLRKPSATGHFGVVHGNGGLGYRQGVALLKQAL